jgi:formate-dependent nitrite reductase membrane component NrfD
VTEREGGAQPATDDIGREGVQNFASARNAVVGSANASQVSEAGRRRQRLRDGEGRRRGRGRGGERKMVPDAEFTSYYGRPVLKAAPWGKDIPAYLFLGGLAGGSSLLAAGADLTDRPTLRRASRIGALVGISLSFGALVHDLGRPERFVNMLRVAKLTSPMSTGTWILTVYGPAAGLAGAAELAGMLAGTGKLPRAARPASRLLSRLARPAGIGAAVIGPAVASYTAVLLADTATPSWHDARRELPFVFVGSAAAAAGGLGLLGASPADAGPARRLAIAGAAVELAAERQIEQSMGLSAEPLHDGPAGKLLKASKALTASGAGLALLSGLRPQSRLSRAAASVAGLALMAGSAATRFGIFEAGQASARDPKYTVVPQRERVNQRQADEASEGDG